MMLKNTGKIFLLALLLTTSFALKASSIKQTNYNTAADGIDLDFDNIPVRTALQTLAKFAHINISINEKVNGNISLSLKNILWPQALDVILATQGLVQRKVGDVVIIAPAEQLLAQKTEQNQVNKAIGNSQLLVSKAFHIKYGNAKTYYDNLKYSNNGLLSTRGLVVMNQRTNTLFVQDTNEKINLIENYLQQTDIPAKQIEIAARIVTIDESFQQQLGVNWKAASTMLNSNNTGNNRFKLDFSAAAIGGTEPANIAMATLANNVLIGLELSAIEAAGGGEILSSPRLRTADQQEAVIEQGTEIPYNETTKNGGSAIAFKKALLRLKVTPQITPNNKVLLRLEVNQDAKSTDTSAGDTPLIDTRHIVTNVLVKNGETVVLGGIYEHSKSHTVVRVPFISSIPILGKLFRSRGTKNTRKELLIFVTPHIVGTS